VSFHLAYADDVALLDSSRPIVKAHERTAFADAIAVLAETKGLRDRALSDAEAAREDGRREGLEEAKAEARHAVAASLADIATAIDAHAEARRADIAEAAFAAARAIVGELDQTDVMHRVVDRTLARFDTETPMTIDVAPALAADLRHHVAALSHVSITENADLGPTDCHVLTASGRIIASLSVQFDALAGRWGLKKEETADAD
jgi:flagellar biosynthesis/type III secretory pathway protein FliH